MTWSNALNQKLQHQTAVTNAVALAVTGASVAPHTQPRSGSSRSWTLGPSAGPSFLWALVGWSGGTRCFFLSDGTRAAALDAFAKELHSAISQLVLLCAVVCCCVLLCAVVCCCVLLRAVVCCCVLVRVVCCWEYSTHPAPSLCM